MDLEELDKFIDRLIDKIDRIAPKIIKWTLYWNLLRLGIVLVFLAIGAIIVIVILISLISNLPPPQIPYR
ncbi:hypothetical protein Igag_0930 [Ignisphaera aggregans DSM 17230]|uniref:Uncharacterized protein n=1 Tax=Ignisphaera aggregans (strain DSM 17230 / JCM 13409 / AQ1.S1) TaxID=583356 RepID=E0STY0_IGNAA|nr:hypothetical protein Igag_0930 [Ignisphaera aggregans DSM 17230]